MRQRIDIKTIFKKNPSLAIKDIEEGIQVLERWDSEFRRTRTAIENEQTMVRWDFTNQKQIFEKPLHMVKILDNLKTACRIIKEFHAILSEDLAAVTGSRTDIDAVRDKVSEHVGKLSGFVNDIFLPEVQEDWESYFKAFLQGVDNVEEETIALIHRTFSEKLNSASGAFDLLNSFNDVETRPKIRDQFEHKYSDVIKQYQLELN